MRKSLWVKIAVLVGVVLAAPAAWSGWHYYRARPSYLLRRGQQAVAAGNDGEVRRVARLLDDQAHPAAAHLLRGWMWLRHARVQQMHHAADDDGESLAALAGRLVGSAAACDALPVIARPVMWTATALTPLPLARPSRRNDAFVRALDEFSRIQDDGKIGAEGTVRAAECLLELGARHFAIEALTDLVARQPDVLAAHRWLAATYIDLNDGDQALPHLREWSRLDPADGRPWRWMGLFVRDDRQYEESVTAYREALKRRLDERVRNEVRQELADTLASTLHDYQQALEVLDEGPMSFQQTPDALALRVRSLADLGRSQEAETVVAQALRDHPQDEKLLECQGTLWWQMERAADAIAPLQKAAHLNPYNERVHQLLAQAYQQVGKADQAAQHRAQAEAVHHLQDQIGELYVQAQLHPQDADVRYRLGELCLKTHQFDKACTWLRAALASNPQHATARLALGAALAAGGRQHGSGLAEP